MNWIWNWIRQNPKWAILIVILLVFAPVAVLQVLFLLGTALVELVSDLVAPIFDESLR